MNRRWVWGLCFSLLTALPLAAGCGNKGDLYLPEAADAVQAPSPKPAEEDDAAQ